MPTALERALLSPLCLAGLPPSLLQAAAAFSTASEKTTATRTHSHRSSGVPNRELSTAHDKSDSSCATQRSAASERVGTTAEAQPKSLPALALVARDVASLTRRLQQEDTEAVVKLKELQEFAAAVLYEV